MAELFREFKRKYRYLHIAIICLGVVFLFLPFFKTYDNIEVYKTSIRYWNLYNADYKKTVEMVNKSEYNSIIYHYKGDALIHSNSKTLKGSLRDSLFDIFKRNYLKIRIWHNNLARLKFLANDTLRKIKIYYYFDSINPHYEFPEAEIVYGTQVPKSDKWAINVEGNWWLYNDVRESQTYIDWRNKDKESNYETLFDNEDKTDLEKEKETNKKNVESDENKIECTENQIKEEKSEITQEKHIKKEQTENKISHDYILIQIGTYSYPDVKTKYTNEQIKVEKYNELYRYYINKKFRTIEEAENYKNYIIKKYHIPDNEKPYLKRFGGENK